MPRPKKTTEIAFPRTLYKPADVEDPTATKCGNVNRGNAYHSVLVNDEKERRAAMQIGYYDDFMKACAANPNDEPTPEDMEEEETNAKTETANEAGSTDESERTTDSETGSEDSEAESEDHSTKSEIDEGF